MSKQIKNIVKIAAPLAKHNKRTVDYDLLLEQVDMRNDFRSSVEGAGVIAKLQGKVRLERLSFPTAIFYVHASQFPRLQVVGKFLYCPFGG